MSTFLNDWVTDNLTTILSFRNVLFLVMMLVMRDNKNEEKKCFLTLFLMKCSFYTSLLFNSHNYTICRKIVYARLNKILQSTQIKGSSSSIFCSLIQELLEERVSFQFDDVKQT